MIFCGDRQGMQNTRPPLCCWQEFNQQSWNLEVRQAMIMGTDITCLKHSSGLVNCTSAKIVLDYSGLSPQTRNRVDWCDFDSCRVGLIESKLSKCLTLDVSIGVIIHAISMETLSAERVCCVYLANQYLQIMDLSSYLTYVIQTGLWLPCFWNIWVIG
jgi:hypothetical protein